MFTFFGILSPAADAGRASAEAPRKKPFFGVAIDLAGAPQAEIDALYLAGKQPEPRERLPERPERSS